MLNIRNVTRRYGDFIAVRELDLDVDGGTIFGFLGPNGAGKTTTMKMICGLIRPTEGTITVDGFDVVKSPIEVKKRIGYVPDRPHLYEKLTAEEYMYFIAGLYGIEAIHGRKKAKELIELFGLGHVRHKLVESFSHGMKQRLVMASVLLHEPRRRSNPRRLHHRLTSRAHRAPSRRLLGPRSWRRQSARQAHDSLDSRPRRFAYYESDPSRL